MPAYIILFSYAAPAWQRLMNSAGDRTAAISATAEALGGAVRSVHWMLGPYDGVVLLEAPDSVSAAAVSVTAMASGAFRTVQTHELFSQAQLEAMLGQAASAAAAYTPPGAAGPGQ